jgi:hypothetical protein
MQQLLTNAVSSILWRWDLLYHVHDMKSRLWSQTCVFVCFELHELFFNYLAIVTITDDRAANLDLCFALTAFSSEDSFTCHTYCDTGPPFLRKYPKDPWFSILNAVLLAKEQSLPILNVLGLTWPARAGLELMTSRMVSESTTTRLPQVRLVWNYFTKEHSLFTLDFK